MANLVYLTHRMPYPPDKGDKVRSFHVLQHLTKRHNVFLGTFVDDPQDLQHIGILQTMCSDVLALPISPTMRRITSLSGLLTGEALTLHYYRDARLGNWLDRTIESGSIDACVIFSSSMAQYAERHPETPFILDLVDVDSAKWSEYAVTRRGPLSWLYSREGSKLLGYERSAVSRAEKSFLVTDKEAALFLSLAPEAGGKLEVSCNGVNAEFFSPQHEFDSPYEAGHLPIVFTGAMDYWPNVDAVCWFAEAVLPRLRVRWPNCVLHIVGRNPTPAVTALASSSVVVTGTVPDVRPYLKHAAAVVAPLRLARGVQNKVLEAMAMGRPVVAASSCVQAIEAREGVEILAAQDSDGYTDNLSRLLGDRRWADALGMAGRRCVMQHYSWPARLSGFDQCLERIQQRTRSVAAKQDEAGRA